MSSRDSNRLPPLLAGDRLLELYATTEVPPREISSVVGCGPLGLTGNRADGSLWPCGTCLLPLCPAWSWAWPERSLAAILKVPPSWVQDG